jgi:hypothetical protein
MNTLQNIYNKLAEDKTELAKHEVELANINDFNKAVQGTEYLYKEFNKVYGELDKLVPSVIKEGEAYLISLDNAMDKSNELFTKFKEIGLDWTATPEYKAFKNLMVKGDRGTVQTMVSRVKNL